LGIACAKAGKFKQALNRRTNGAQFIEMEVLLVAIRFDAMMGRTDLIVASPPYPARRIAL